MSTLRHSFRPGSLSEVQITLDAQGGDLSSHLALLFSDLGARVVIRDENRPSHRHVHLSLGEPAMFAEEACGAPEAAAALIRMFSKAAPAVRAAIHLCSSTRDAIDILEGPAPAEATSQILIVANESRAERIVLEQLLALQDDRQVHAMLVPSTEGPAPAVTKFPAPPATFDIGSMAALIVLLLGPDGRGIPNQSFRFDGPGRMPTPV